MGRETRAEYCGQRSTPSIKGVRKSSGMGVVTNPSLQLDSLQPLSFDGYHCHYIRTVS